MNESIQDSNGKADVEMEMDPISAEDMQANRMNQINQGNLPANNASSQINNNAIAAPHHALHINLNNVNNNAHGIDNHRVVVVDQHPRGDHDEIEAADEPSNLDSRLSSDRVIIP